MELVELENEEEIVNIAPIDPLDLFEVFKAKCANADQQLINDFEKCPKTILSFLGDFFNVDNGLNNLISLYFTILFY